MKFASNLLGSLHTTALTAELPGSYCMLCTNQSNSPELATTSCESLSSTFTVIEERPFLANRVLKLERASSHADGYAETVLLAGFPNVSRDSRRTGMIVPEGSGNSACRISPLAVSARAYCALPWTVRK